MLDGHSTSVDWQKHPGKTCVWAVGSFEQHSGHLPLASDTIEVDTVARWVAEALDAPLLPALPFGTSLEMTGFRGTLTLRPETLMQVVRDVADEVERQRFTALVLVNGHGGNHALVPVVRDLNRVNRALKILLVNFWEFGDPALERVPAEAQPAFHASAWETSLMLALRPDLVRDERADLPPAPEVPVPLRQSDLTTFGIGCFNPAGATGSPSLASRERGEAILASIRERIVPFVRERLALLETRRRYSGQGGIAYRPLAPGDIAEAMELKNREGWNQVPADWRMLLDLAPDTCRAAVHNGQVVGTATAVPYGGSMAWIGMVLVHPEYRHGGIATALVRQLLDRLSGLACVKLDAAPSGEPVYRKLGFHAEHRITRWWCPLLGAVPASGGEVAPIGAPDLAAVAKLDHEAFGAPREALLGRLAERAPEVAWQRLIGKVVRAACFGRPGWRGMHVGPVSAQSLPDAQAVLSAALRELRGQAAIVDVPEAQAELAGWLRGLGFVPQRAFLRMFRGTNVVGDPARYFALGGAELG